ncbi:MAG: orotidine 5-phosphate decarboxylase [Thermoprotei archaeon]|nr:MAG: orotidine 5-phosphate decarboxylase [Thermoprotei archaeon]
MRRLQVALDLTDLNRALSIASRVVEECDPHVLMLEAGTPLIKAEGVKAVKRLAEEFGEIPIVADMKTADAGEVEAELAIGSGASYTTVLAVASDETIARVVETAHRMGGRVIGDLMCVDDPLTRALELDELGIDVVCYHVPVDVQRARGVNKASVAEVLRELAASLKAELAVAGGITPETATLYLESGADILIVGKYIYASPDPGSAAKRLVELL